MAKPILCLDFDGVLHSYTSGWKGPTEIPDPPTNGAMIFLRDAIEEFEVHIFSSRSAQPGGIEAMQAWVNKHLVERFGFGGEMAHISGAISWPTEKPPAMVTIDDRAIRFDGTWPSITDLLHFRPWNR